MSSFWFLHEPKLTEAQWEISCNPASSYRHVVWDRTHQCSFNHSFCVESSFRNSSRYFAKFGLRGNFRGHILQHPSETRSAFKIRSSHSGSQMTFADLQGWRCHSFPSLCLHRQPLPGWAAVSWVQLDFPFLQTVAFDFCLCSAHPWELPASAFSRTSSLLGNSRLQLIFCISSLLQTDQTLFLQPLPISRCTHLQIILVTFC